MSRMLTVARKELWTYFSSPTAYIFLGTYLLITMFTFFWVEKFFSRNLADLRPLFDWMPLLLIFLISTLTMKMWSEERRMGTIEFLMTLPVRTVDLVVGKFLACLFMVGVSLLLTFGMAFSVGFLGNVDWGPVFGAYFASLLLASTYIAVGLYVSSKTNSQIVSLIISALICSIFYMLGSNTIVNFFGNFASETLKLIGTGSRFDSISRGVIDFRDVYYYVSLAMAFLVANIFSLQTLKWSKESPKQHHTYAKTFVVLLVLNVLGANFWLQKIPSLRADLTASRLYSISPATREVVTQLDEPLLIRGYFSARTHPLLAPLVPSIRDFLREYQIVGRGKVRTEFIDPRENPTLEAEANRKYNIEPAPFQIEDRSSVSMVNSYFNIVVQYGDQFEVLGFDDLIDVKYDGMGHINVQLRNLEYDITRAIKKTMQGFKNTDSFFAKLDHNIKFVAYVSEEKLPKQLQTLNSDVQKAIEDYKKSSNGKLEVEFHDPSKDQNLAKTIAEKYGFMPQSMGLLSMDSFYLYYTLIDGEKVYSLGVPQDLSVTGFKHNMEAALKRMMPGFLRNLGIYTPPGGGGFNPMMGQMGGGGKQFRALTKKLEQSYSIKNVDLSSGVVPSDIDVLLVIAPHEFQDKQVFAIDQFLMKGGSVLLATSQVSVNRDQRSFMAETKESGLEKWLASYGVDVPKELVLDKSNVGFPTITKRVVQGVTIREPRIAPYPFFVDVRAEGLNHENAITAGVPQITFSWPSPVLVNADVNKDRKVTTLVQSSPHSWRTSDINIDPNPVYELGFPEGSNQKSVPLAVLIEGRFESYFKGKNSPLIAKKEEEKPAKDPKKKDKEETKKDENVYGVLEKSPSVARLIIFGSNEFISDESVQVLGMLSGTQYTNTLQLIENALDWSVQDRTLLAIRSHGHFARTLLPMTDGQKQGWEIFNYVFALFGLFAVWGVFRLTQRRSRRLYKSLNIVV